MCDELQNISKDAYFLEGIISVEAAVKSGKREIVTVYVDHEKYRKRDRKIIRFVSFLKNSRIPFELCEREFIDTIAQGTTHGGVVAIVKERVYTELHEFLASLRNNDYAVFLDGVEDPYNFGYSVRSLYAFGCKGFILPQRNWMSAANIVAKSSAGASELCSIAISQDDETALSIIREHDVAIVCAGLRHESVSIHDFNITKPFILFIGGEKRGISKTFFENADSVVHIPYLNSEVRYSLPTASCAAIFGNIISSKKQSCD